MDYSALNTALWNPILQLGLIALCVLIANILIRKIPVIRKSMLPTAVLAGFIMLILKVSGVATINVPMMETLTYHGIAIGFIAMSLRIPEASTQDKGKLIGLKSGAVIVSSYMIQGITGLLISIGLAYTVMPGLFKASGILLPLGYGQGPGQANNIGMTYENLGFVGGHSFGLSIAAAGYICACVIGVIYINFLAKQGKIAKRDVEIVSGSVTIDTFQNENEIPVSESIDRLSVQIMLITLTYLLTYGVTYGITTGLGAVSEGLANTLNSLLWGFNFIIGSALAIVVRIILKKLQNSGVQQRQYQNNYLLSRISGLAFDIMIVAGLASIEPADLSGLWVPFMLMVVLGAVVTLMHLKFVCRKVYGDYFYEGLVSMYGMMTGTISSGVLLLREVDPDMKTPAANNLVVGSSFGIILGAPILILVGIAPKSTTMTFVALGCLAVYYVILLGIINIRKGQKD